MTSRHPGSCLLASVLLLFFASGPVKSQQTNDRKAALGRPSPQSMRIQVVKGQTVRITLSSETKSKNSQVEYIVRDYPALGVAGNLIPTPEDPTKATIIYQSARQSQGDIDVFTFSSRYKGGYYSAPVRVIIELSEPKPIIEAPASFDFGNLILGDEQVREILIKNTGNIEFTKLVQLSPPLSLVQPADGRLSIPPGGSTMLKIKCRPEQVGSFSTSYVFQDEAVIKFFGNSSAPFFVQEKKLELKWNEQEQNRQGSLMVSNKANSKLAITIDPPLRAKYLGKPETVGNQLTLSPEKQASLRFVLPKEDVHQLKGMLKLSTANYSLNIPVESSPTPPRIQLELPDPGAKGIDFGTAKPGEIVNRSFLVKNLGGTGLVLGMGVNPPFQIARRSSRSQAINYSVGPESSAVFMVKFIAPSQQSGQFLESLEISTDTGTFHIPLQGQIHDPNAPAGDNPIPPHVKSSIAFGKIAPDPDASKSAKENPALILPPLPPSPDPEAEEDFRSPTGFYTREYIERDYSEILSTPEDFLLHKNGRNKMTLAWKLPHPNQTVFEIDVRQMLYNQANNRIESVWVPYNDVTYKRSGDTVYATIKGLNPSSIYEYRVLTVGDGGKFSHPSKSFGAQTLPPPDYTPLKWGLLLALLASVGILLRRYWVEHDGTIPMPTYWPRTIRWPFE